MRITGTVKYRASFEIEVPITQEDFEKLSEREMNNLIEDYIDANDVSFFETEIEDEIDY